MNHFKCAAGTLARPDMFSRLTIDANRQFPMSFYYRLRNPMLALQEMPFAEKSSVREPEAAPRAQLIHTDNTIAVLCNAENLFWNNFIYHKIPFPSP